MANELVASVYWQAVFGTLVFVSFAWAAIGVIDIFYYNRLLIGAVDAIIDHEKKNQDLTLSTRIEQRFSKDAKPKIVWPQWLFYVAVFVVLLIGCCYAGWKMVALGNRRVAEEPLAANQTIEHKGHAAGQAEGRIKEFGSL